MRLSRALFGKVRKRAGIQHLVRVEKGSWINKREYRLSRLHLCRSRLMLEGTYSPEIPHVITRRRSSAPSVIHLTRVVTSGVHNLGRPSVVK